MKTQAIRDLILKMFASYGRSPSAEVCETYADILQGCTVRRIKDAIDELAGQDRPPTAWELMEQCTAVHGAAWIHSSEAPYCPVSDHKMTECPELKDDFRHDAKGRLVVPDGYIPDCSKHRHLLEGYFSDLARRDLVMRPRYQETSNGLDQIRRQVQQHAAMTGSRDPKDFEEHRQQAEQLLLDWSGSNKEPAVNISRSAAASMVMGWLR